MLVEPYTPAAKVEWDELVRSSRNGTFLFQRDYMEYHQDRFEDCSLLVRDLSGRLLALLPAHRRGAVVESHAGLTYGGFVMDDRMRAERMLEALDRVLDHLRREACERLVYRPVPHVYHRRPAEEDLYCLFRRGAVLSHRAVLSVLASDSRAPRQARRRRSLSKARRAGLGVEESDALSGYWELLTEVLWITYRSRPVHSLEEIRMLRSRFPHNIRLFHCHRDDRQIAGVLVYEDERVARAQYIAASEAGKRLGALDLLLDHLLETVYRDKPFFDLGSSSGESDSGLNEGVIEFKESWGARAVTLDTYEIDVAPGRRAERGTPK